MDRIELNKAAKRIQSRLSRQGVTVVLEDVRTQLENHEVIDETIEQTIEDYFIDAATKPVVTQKQPGSNLAVKNQSETMVATAAQELNLSLTKEEISSLAADFTNGYSKVLSDVGAVLELLKAWVNHQETTAAVEIDRLERELIDAISGSNNRTSQKVKGLLSTTKKTQSDFMDTHKQEMEAINSFFADLMAGVPQ